MDIRPSHPAMGSSAVTLQPPSVVGPAEKEPSRSVTRSRIPSRPKPRRLGLSFRSASTASSAYTTCVDEAFRFGAFSMTRRARPFPVRNETVASLPGACRSTLVSDSCITR